MTLLSWLKSEKVIGQGVSGATAPAWRTVRPMQWPRPRSRY